MANSQHVTVRLARPFTVVVAGTAIPPARLGSRRSRQLLLMLAAHRHRAVTVDELVGWLWPDAPPRRPDDNVAVLVSRLRRVLGADSITGGRDGYRLGAPPRVEVDLDVAAALVDEAERSDGAPGLAASAAGRAVSMLGPLAGELGAEWADELRTEHTTLLRRARHALVRAELELGDTVGAIQTAREAIDDDAFDEQARRDLISAHAGAGERAAALTDYETLRRLLADELGADPSVQTHELYLAILRDEPPPSTAAPHRSARSTLTGRDREIAALTALWDGAARGSLRAVLVVGEAGIGKTRLADEFATVAERTGGTVLRARCYESERALFLQPIADALTAALSRLPSDETARLVSPDADVLSGVLPGIATQQTAPGGTIAFRNRRAFEATCALVERMARRSPVLLVVDDLQVAGRSCLNWLHYLQRHAAASPVLVMATVRVEAAPGIRDSIGSATELDLGPLDRDAVHALASAAGHPELTERIMRQTSGNPLYVGEILRAVRQGTVRLPGSLQAAVLDRVRQLGTDVADTLKAAAVVGATFDPRLLGGMLRVAESTAALRCERALAARLIVPVGQQYEFAHDLVRELLYESIPPPTRVAHHRRAADLLAGRPEAVAAHAAAIDDWSRAARAWVVAAEQAIGGLAVHDAEHLSERALTAARRADLREVEARALLIRGRAREAVATYRVAHDDLLAAVTIAHEIGDQRLEMTALRHLGGDVASALGVPVDDYARHIDRALHIAESLGDRAAEAELHGWFAVLDANRLRFTDALRHADRALAAARGSGDEQTLAYALDGAKTAYAYLGEVGHVAAITDELEPLLRRQGDLWMLQWAVFESAFVPLAAGDYAGATRLIEQAVEINRRSGYVAYECWYLAHLGWVARLQADLDKALDVGQRAVEQAQRLPHAWWTVAACAIHAGTLLEAGDPEAAVAMLEPARKIAEGGCAESYLLRCLAPLAEASESREVLESADAMLATAECPDGSAWLLGADAYFSVTRAWLKHGEPDRAARTLAPFLTAARRIPWRPLTEQAESLSAAIELQRASAR